MDVLVFDCQVVICDTQSLVEGLLVGFWDLKGFEWKVVIAENLIALFICGKVLDFDYSYSH